MLSKNINKIQDDSDLFITRKRKKYKFAKFNELENCFQFDEWLKEKSNIVSSKTDLIIEVGAGTGLLSVELAKRHPENFYVAVDIKSDRLYTGAKYAKEHGIKNITFVRSDIWQLKELFIGNNVKEIWITFPDPYTNDDQTRLKKSDAKHRLTHPRFLEVYKEILLESKSDSKRVCFKTDNKPLFDWSKEQFSGSGWQIIEITNDLHNSELSDDYKIKTSYETKFSAQGLPIHLLTAKIES